MTKRLGILTGGGDCPGLNAVIRGVLYKATKQYGWEVVGIKYGWKGMVKNITLDINLENTEDIVREGGTILKSSRTNPYKIEGGVDAVVKTMQDLKLDALVAIGGEDTCGVASKLFKDRGINVIGVPKTIDNDLSGTDVTFGFDTCINIATDMIDNLHTTAKSHERVLVCEVMGRHAGWIASYAGIAGNADYILVPEEEVNIDELCATVKEAYKCQDYAIVVTAEGARLGGEDVTKDAELDAFGHVKLGGIGERLAKIIEEKTGCETRSTVLGHIQRGGRPSAYDSVLGTRLGCKAADMVASGDWGKMAAIIGNTTQAVPLEVAVGTLKTLDMSIHEDSKIFFGANKLGCAA
jgi:ATP-dependent phosphofructokinase / diphosphate-dependent phosphofructokinase